MVLVKLLRIKVLSIWRRRHLCLHSRGQLGIYDVFHEEEGKKSAHHNVTPPAMEYPKPTSSFPANCEIDWLSPT